MKEKKKIGFEIWRLLYPIIIYFAINIIVTITVVIVIIMNLSAEGMDYVLVGEMAVQKVMDKALLITIITSVICLFVFIPLYFGDKKKEKKLGALVKYENAKIDKWILVAILGFSAALCLNILISYTGLAEKSPGFDVVSEAIYESSLFIQILATVILAPIIEELLVRGLIYKRMTRWTSPLIAALASSALFGLIHMNLVQFVYAFLIGLLLALVYEKFQNIWAPILFHFAANATSIMITNIPGAEELFESSVNTITICVITGLAMITLTYYFLKMEKVSGEKIEIEDIVGLESQMQVQEKEKELYK